MPSWTRSIVSLYWIYKLLIKYSCYLSAREQLQAASFTRPLLLLFSRYVVSDPLATPWTVACQAALSVGFSRQEYWSGLPFPPTGDLPDPGIEPRFPALQSDSIPCEPPGKRKESTKHLCAEAPGSEECLDLILSSKCGPKWTQSLPSWVVTALMFAWSENVLKWYPCDHSAWWRLWIPLYGPFLSSE